MSIRIGEIIIASENVFPDSNPPDRVKKVFFLEEQKFIGIVVKNSSDEDAAIAKLERYMCYCLYTMQHAVEMAYAIDDDTVVLISLLSNNTYIVDEILIEEEDEASKEQAILMAVDGHFGGNGTLFIQTSADEIRKSMCKESKKKLYILALSIIVLAIVVFVIVQAISKEPPSLPEATPPPPLILDQKREVEMKRIGTKMVLDAIETKLKEIAESDFDYAHTKIGSITFSQFSQAPQGPGEYPKLTTSLMFNMELNYAAVDSQKVSDGLFGKTETKNIEVAPPKQNFEASSKLTEICLNDSLRIASSGIDISKRDQQTITITISDANAIDTIRNINSLVDNCPAYLNNLKTDGTKMSGELVLYGIN